MNAEELCSTNVAVITRDETLQHAAHMMRENHVGDLVVVEKTDGGKRPVGIITDRDLVMAIAKHGSENFAKKKVGNKMADVLIMARNQDPVEEVLQNMRDNGIRRVPVVDVDDNLTGILTFDDLIGYYGDQLMKMGELVQQELSREVLGS
mgnify:CR=1 FL=1